jgi:hypothetical protein
VGAPNRMGGAMIRAAFLLFLVMPLAFIVRLLANL